MDATTTIERAVHPCAEIFPMMDGEAFTELVNDIRHNGLREAICLHPDGSILDGRNRYRACLEADVEPTFVEWNGEGSPVAYVVSLNLRRRHLNESQRSMVAAKIATLNHGQKKSDASIDASAVSQPDAAKLLNVSRPSVQRAAKVIDHGTPELVQAVERGEVSVSAASDIADAPPEQQRQVVAKGEAEILRVAKQIKSQRRVDRIEARAEQRKEILLTKHPLKGDSYALHTCAVADLEQHVDAGTVDVFVTDPPYPAEFLGVYADLFRVASRLLRNGGHCLVMCGQSHWPAIMEMVEESDLNYQWTIGYFTPGQSTQVFGRRVKSNWKPILWLTKGLPDCEHIDDTITSDRNDKRFHEWGQSVGGMAQLIERFTVKGEMVVDPFVGGGTTGVAAVMCDRLFVGADIDDSCVQQTAKRLAEVKG